eukprot:CAMPEP_0119159816 /NCGR_PEP_ID=MMETSP1310-20130426/53953_1 /TAXON_ID=464262 /ORGANISM="Genus nov. species nov., Strain RCC2339" /LENGTH=140 /DNA_ID=CAMNT_0007152445 /DNA_START=564 /DNA_END=986 /DNA_ORIENTATION=+
MPPMGFRNPTDINGSCSDIPSMRGSSEEDNRMPSSPRFPAWIAGFGIILSPRAPCDCVPHRRSARESDSVGPDVPADGYRDAGKRNGTNVWPKMDPLALESRSFAWLLPAPPSNGNGTCRNRCCGTCETAESPSHVLHKL